MIEVFNINLSPDWNRLGTLCVRYYDLAFCCQICVYKYEKLYIRMPEIWVNRETKKQFMWWPTKDESVKFQEMVLKKVFDMVGLTLETAVQMKKDFFASQKQMTNKRKEITLSESE